MLGKLTSPGANLALFRDKGHPGGVAMSLGQSLILNEPCHLCAASLACAGEKQIPSLDLTVRWDHGGDGPALGAPYVGKDLFLGPGGDVVPQGQGFRGKAIIHSDCLQVLDSVS